MLIFVNKHSPQPFTVTGGYNSKKTYKSMFIYDLTEKKWYRGPDFSIARRGHSCVKIFRETGEPVVLIAGGFHRESLQKTVEIFDLTLNEWTNGIVAECKRLQTSFSGLFHRESVTETVCIRDTDTGYRKKRSFSYWRNRHGSRNLPAEYRYLGMDRGAGYSLLPAIFRSNGYRLYRRKLRNWKMGQKLLGGPSFQAGPKSGSAEESPILDSTNGFTATRAIHNGSQRFTGQPSP